MKIFNFNYKTIGHIIFVIIFLSTSSAKSLDKFDKADRVADYFSGILLLSENQYEKSKNYFKKLDGLESSHNNYSVKYLYSLVNSGNIKEAFTYSKKLEKQNLDSFESHLITGIFYLKNSDKKLAEKHFLKAKNKSSGLILNNYVSNSLYNWSRLSSLSQGKLQLNELDKRFDNIKKIQNFFLHCFFDSSETRELFAQLTSNQNTDFSRYNYFYALYLASAGNTKNAKEVVDSALQLNPRNLLMNQYKINLKKKENFSSFSCKKKEHIMAEILYITANALSSQSIYPLSNFYLNLAKYLNESFHSYDTLLAENFYKIDNFKKAKIIYKNISKNGEAFHWYSSKQLAKIFIKEGKQNEALKLLSKSYNNLLDKEIYETFDYAEFLKNNEKFEESILFYSKIIEQVQTNHPLYAEATDGRGVAYERTGKWEEAEKDLLSSLNANPNQAYVINYLAYTWIEQGIKIKKSLAMLEKANKLRANDPYITDSLGWALFKLERYKKAKDYLQLAVKLMPGDPIVNDHYGDVLWKNGKKIQARYYWNYVLNLEQTEEELKQILEEKIIKGL
jgi:tetratricopeptide (TPR) repeat protein